MKQATISRVFHPDCAAALAYLFGMTPPSLKESRVLDLTPSKITCILGELAREVVTVSSQNIANVTCVSSLEEVVGSFDYILCRGGTAFSALDRTIGARLSLNGLFIGEIDAAVGGDFTNAVSSMLQASQADSRLVSQMLRRAWDKNDPLCLLWSEELRLRAESDELNRSPEKTFSISGVARHLHEIGLSYVGNPVLRQMNADVVELSEIAQNQLQVEDLIAWRHRVESRVVIACRFDQTFQRSLQPERLLGLHIVGRGLRPYRTAQATGVLGAQQFWTDDSADVRDALLLLAGRGVKGISGSRLLRGVESTQARTRLAHLLFEFALRGCCEFRCAPDIYATEWNESPKFVQSAYQFAPSGSILTHGFDFLNLNPIERSIVALSNGERTRTEIAEIIEDEIRFGHLKSSQNAFAAVNECLDRLSVCAAPKDDLQPIALNCDALFILGRRILDRLDLSPESLRENTLPPNARSQVVESVELLEKAVSLAPDDLEMRATLSAAKALLGQNVEATEIARETLIRRGLVRHVSKAEQPKRVLVLHALSKGHFYYAAHRLVLPKDTNLPRLLDSELFETIELFVDALPPSLDLAALCSSVDCIYNAVGEPAEAPLVSNFLNKINQLHILPRPVINPPDLVALTDRAHNAKKLQGIPSLRFPKTIEITIDENARETLAAAGLNPPLILRRPDTQAGRSMLRVDSEEELALALQTRQGERWLAIEFIDFASEDGTYTKYRCFFIGGTCLPSLATTSRRWNIHAADRADLMDDASYQAKEREFVEEMQKVLGTRMSALQSLLQHCALDCFGVDFALTPDGIAVFELNAAMAQDPSRAQIYPYLQPAFSHLAQTLSQWVLTRINAGDSGQLAQGKES